MDRDAEIFQALGDPTRLRLLNLLRQTGEVCVCELVDALRVPQYNISRHLQILRQAGLVHDRRLLLRALDQLGEARGDFRQDEARAGRRLKLRRDGLCCVGLVQRIGTAKVSH
jgi:DNA-binding transcriptional ArsR family regulator